MAARLTCLAADVVALLGDALPGELGLKLLRLAGRLCPEPEPHVDAEGRIYR